jgi:hypothetical protein
VCVHGKECGKRVSAAVEESTRQPVSIAVVIAQICTGNTVAQNIHAHTHTI